MLLTCDPPQIMAEVDAEEEAREEAAEAEGLACARSVQSDWDPFLSPTLSLAGWSAIEGDAHRVFNLLSSLSGEDQLTFSKADLVLVREGDFHLVIQNPVPGCFV
jgi:hypothetical protein